MLELIGFSVGLVSVCVILLCLGVLFFNKTADRAPCGSVPEAMSHDDCPSQKAGLCPVLDRTGVVKMANRARVTYTKQDISS